MWMKTAAVSTTAPPPCVGPLIAASSQLGWISRQRCNSTAWGDSIFESGTRDANFSKQKRNHEKGGNADSTDPQAQI